MDFLEESQIIQIHPYLTTFSIVILFYDHALTFESEVAHIWSQPWIKSSTIFLVNRYLAFFSSITTLVLAHKTNLDPRSCHAYSLWHQLILIICQILVCVIVSLRIYALYNCSKRVMWFLILFAVLLTGVVAWSMTDQKKVTNHGTTQECRLSVSFETSVRLSLCWVALFVYDSTIFGLTMYKTWKSKMYRSLATSGSVPILTLLLRDGAVYFMLMALVNMSNILTFYFAPVFLRGGLSTFSSALSTTLVSRMMLNLHCAHAQEGVLSTIPGLMFAGTDSEDDHLDTMVEVEFPIPYHQKATESNHRTVFMARP